MWDLLLAGVEDARLRSHELQRSLSVGDARGRCRPGSFPDLAASPVLTPRLLTPRLFAPLPYLAGARRAIPTPTSSARVLVWQVHGVFSGWSASDYTSTVADAAVLAYEVYGPQQRIIDAAHQNIMVPQLESIESPALLSRHRLRDCTSFYGRCPTALGTCRTALTTVSLRSI